METQLKCKIVMLASTDKVKPYDLCIESSQLRIFNRPEFVVSKPKVKQHLYFLAQPTPEQRKQGIGVIKEGDWFISKSGAPLKCLSYHVNLSQPKIEATTDPSLSQINKSAFDRSHDRIIPLIPQSFVEKYVEKQGKIDEVMIELADTNGISGGPINKKRLNDLYVRMDNTVICSSVKDSWTREEVVALCEKAFSDAYDARAQVEECGALYSPDYVIVLKEWIEQNL